jgi:hypothetical protein
VRRLEVTVGLEALELLASVAVGGESSCLKAIANVREIRDPAQIDWNGVERDEEAGEEEEGHGHDGGEEHTVLDIHGRADDETNTLSDKRDEQAGGEEEAVAEPLHGLRCEVIDDRDVDEAEDCLEMERGVDYDRLNDLICLMDSLGTECPIWLSPSNNCAANTTD